MKPKQNWRQYMVWFENSYGKRCNLIHKCPNQQYTHLTIVESYNLVKQDKDS
ncbi:hypothetical protein CLOHYLEM_04424 [[Clostridium] hylemonae DSM 15053]|uniref:Uncharacterized protein n=1 Tax=[Clostridium] hylemonae DSM 15053 TaxID=553973 RepID=C0BX87_9FIRM|nr:hypothetical protein CLOHYLEM_04424 [[Clostridium] hylemonae DSM 15053]